jgi:hypothetical protein
MANKNFIVHNGLEVGPVKIFAGNGDVISSGNLTSTSTSAITTTFVQKISLQFPTALAGATWYKIGTFSVNSGVGAGETIEFTLVAGQGYAGDSMVKDIVEIRFLSGGSTNVESNYYSLGYREGVQGVKVKSVNGDGTGTSWDVYFYLGADLGKGFVEIKLSPDAKFTWTNTVDSDPGTAAANLVVATNKFVTATSNVVITSGNLYVGGNIYQQGQLVSTSVGNGLTTKVINGNGSIGPFTLGSTPADKDQVQVWWNGIYQPSYTYLIAGSNITFTEPIPTGSNVEVKILAGTGAQLLGTLGDINFDTSPTDGQFLSYDATSSKWVPATSAAQASVTRTAITFAVALGGL